MNINKSPKGINQKQHAYMDDVTSFDLNLHEHIRKTTKVKHIKVVTQ